MSPHESLKLYHCLLFQQGIAILDIFDDGRFNSLPRGIFSSLDDISYFLAPRTIEQRVQPVEVKFVHNTSKVRRAERTIWEE